jgi:hypothetical protein
MPLRAELDGFGHDEPNGERNVADGDFGENDEPGPQSALESIDLGLPEKLANSWQKGFCSEIPAKEK